MLLYIIQMLQMVSQLGSHDGLDQIVNGGIVVASASNKPFVMDLTKRREIQHENNAPTLQAFTYFQDYEK